MFKYKICAFLYLINCLCLARGTDTVPYLVWKFEKPEFENSVLPSGIIDVKNIFEDPLLKSDNVVVFLQDYLSMEDLSNYEDVFKPLSDYMAKSRVLFAPLVDTKTSIKFALTSQGYDLKSLQAGSLSNELPVNETGKTAVIVQLPSTGSSPRRKDALKKSVEVIESVVSKAGQRRPFVFVYAATHSSVDSPSAPHVRVARDAQNAAEGREPLIRQPSKTDPSKVAISGSCVRMQIKGKIRLTIRKYNTTTLHRSLVLTDREKSLSDCQPNVKKLILRYSNVGADNEKFKIGIQLQMTPQGWYFNKVELTENRQKTNLTRVGESVYVPLRKSFVCSQRQSFDSEYFRLDFIGGVQVEPVKDSKTFSQTYDCVNFFTVPIWMGLLVSALLTLILAAGLAGLASVRTMDRFDDPKSKHGMIATGGQTE